VSIRTACLLGVASILCWTLAGPARGAPIPFRGELIVAFAGFTFVSVAGAGIAEVNGDGTGGALTALALPEGVFAATTEFPGTFPLGGIRVTASNGAGLFALTPSGGGGAMPLRGVARLCLLATCSAATIALDLPLSVVGAGGLAQVTGPIDVTITGAQWTKGGATVMRPGATTILGGSARGPLGQAGSTAQPGGRLVLVTPIRVSSSLPGYEDLDSWAELHLEFVPEPSTLALLGSGFAALAAGARRRRRAIKP
jgi:hypothetical protein